MRSYRVCAVLVPLIVSCTLFSAGAANPKHLQLVQQVNERQPVFLLQLLRTADEIQVHIKDPADASEWQTKPSLTLKRRSEAKLFQDLTSADVDKPTGLSERDAPFRFTFLVKKKSVGTAYSKGRLLERRGDAAVHMPAAWRDRLTRLLK